MEIGEPQTVCGKRIKVRGGNFTAVTAQIRKAQIIGKDDRSIADACFNAGTGTLTAPMAWLGVTAYAFQIYYDFSAYSDMAIGLGRLFGFRFPENFNSPYKSKSITEFWRRWHISLSTFLRDYLYIPLGGNRLGPARTYANLLLVMLIDQRPASDTPRGGKRQGTHHRRT